MKLLFLIFTLAGIAGQVKAQHEHHTPVTRDTTEKHSEHKHSDPQKQDTTAAQNPPMSHAFSLNLPMNRNGSGTGWLPDASPMYGYMVHSKKWMYMIHGNIFIRYNHQDPTNKGTRGDNKFDAPNWFMAMAQRQIGKKGLLHLNTMFSLDPLFGGEGYPLLFQTGETFKGQPLVDRQHPHNLFSELSIGYSHAFTRDFDAFLYFGYPGEPALGPVAFMHRPSSLNNPDSPLGHHWQDATHITFGVATAGFRYKAFKVDGSIFTGREPGEARYGFDKAKFDSYSYRLSVNPSSSMSFQVSQAFIKSPEGNHPEEDVKRTTASMLHSQPLTGYNKFLTSALVWGFNNSGDDHQEHSFTFESNLQLDRLALYGRFENIEKSAAELQVDSFDDHQLFKINAFTLGLNYILLREWNTNFALGAQGSLYAADKKLNSVYGNNPVAFEVYVKVSPFLMQMSGK
jgi:hypothetical protein